MVRPAARLEALAWPSSVEVFRADLRTSRDLLRAFEDVDVLIHLAAVVSGGEDAQFAGTVVGTERLLDAMASSTCRRLVLCSSFSVYDFSATRASSTRIRHFNRRRTFTPAVATPSPNGGRNG